MVIFFPFLTVFMSMIFIGIDVSQAYFDVAFPSQKGYRSDKLANQASGFATFLAALPPDAHCVMEATGPYYLRLATALHQAGIAVSVVNPLVIKRFSQMKLSRAKTDKADARLIAEYGRLHQPALWQPPVAFINELQQESSLLEQLLKQRTALGNHHHALQQQPLISEQALRTLEQLLETLNEHIQQLEQSIARKSKAHCAPLLKVLTSIPGIGLKTAVHLLVITHAFERFDSSKQLSAYIGLAPRLYESGSSVRGKAHIAKLGMSQMRKLLYLCALSAKKYNLACQQLYDRLLAKGKAKKLALIAVANKLLKQAFAMGTSLKLYQEPKQNLVPS
jgi:transposase